MLNEHCLMRFLENLNGSRHFQRHGLHHRQILAEGAVMMGIGVNLWVWKCVRELQGDGQNPNADGQTEPFR